MQDAWVPLLLSLKVAGWATALDIVLGVAAAFMLARWRSPLRDVVDSVLTLPLVLPPTVLGYYLLVLLGRRGVFGAWLDKLGIELVFTWQGAVIASMVVAFPLILKSARAAFEGVDPHLERAARMLGLGDVLLGPVRDRFHAHLEGAKHRPPVPIVAAALGDHAGVIGAAVLARDVLA